MTNKLNKILYLLLFTVLSTQCQNMKTKESIDLSKATIKIDSCGIFYKENRLDLGMPLSEWTKIIGKPNRDNHLAFIWDDLGIAIDDWQNERGNVAAIYIFFLNLESPQGQAGELNHARDWRIVTEEWKNNIMENNKQNSEAENRKIVNELIEEYSPKKFIYPFTTYNGYVNLHGFPVGKGMKIDEINAYREDLPFSGLFGYVDDDIDGVNDSGNTTDTFGGVYRAPGEECKDGRLQYYELMYTASGALEYLKIAYESQEDYESRKIRQRDREAREKEMSKNK